MLSDFIPEHEQKRIAEAITEAERHTSGEICVHVTPKCRGDAVRRARKAFNRLGLYATQRRNAVLIFVAYQHRKVAVIGDTGIDRKVSQDFWNDTVGAMANDFADGHIVDGICNAVAAVGDKLAEIFPAERHDNNQLSNEVTYED